MRYAAMVGSILLFVWSHGDASAQQAVAKDLRTVINSYHDRLAKEDEKSWKEVWHSQAPPNAIRVSDWQMLKSVELEFSPINFVDAKGGAAEVRVRCHMLLNVTARKSRQKVSIRWFRDFHLKREGTQWKVFRILALKRTPADTRQVELEIQQAYQAMETSDFKKSLALLQQARRSAENCGFGYGYAVANGDIANCYFELQQYAAARKHFLLAKVDFAAMKDEEAVANQYLGLGGVEEKLGNFSKAMKAYRQADTIAIKQSNNRLRAFVMLNMGSIYQALGQSYQALETMTKGHELLKSSRGVLEIFGGSDRVHFAELGIAQVYASIGRLDDALAIVEAKLKLHAFKKSAELRFQTISLKALIYELKGDYEQAKALYEQCRELAGETQDALATALGGIGNQHYALGNYAQALLYLKQSKDLLLKIGQKFEALEQMKSIGAVYERQGDTALALKIYNEAASKAKELGVNYELGTIYLNQANALATAEDFDQAIEKNKAAIEVLRTVEVERALTAAIMNLGANYTAAKKFQLADKPLREALARTRAVKNSDLLADALINLADNLDYLEKFDEGLPLAREASKIATAIRSYELEWGAATVEGKLLSSLGQYDAARSKLQLAISKIESQRFQLAGREQTQQNFLKISIESYHELIELEIKAGNLAAALAVADKAKAQSLRAAIAQRPAQITAQLSVEEKKEEQELRGKIVGLNQQLLTESTRLKPNLNLQKDLAQQVDDARLAYQSFEAKVVAAKPELRLGQADLQPFELKQLGELLDNEETAAIQFVVLDEQTFAFVARKRKGELELSCTELMLTKLSLEKKVKNLRSAIQKQEAGFHPQSKELSHLLLSPILPKLKDATTWLIIPDEALWGVPFAALKTKAGRYVVQDTTVRLAPSFSVLREMRNRAKQQKAEGSGLLALGNPPLPKRNVSALASRSSGLAQLPQATVEVNQIGEIYKATGERLLAGPLATEQAFKKSSDRADILHLATHAVLNNADPLYSFILLAADGDNREDGFLEAWEIMNMRLTARLAVLSACETAGTSMTGEGLVGLTWAFFAAGCPNVVSSLWKVEDHATKELMVAFHQNLKKSKTRDAATSLREAQLRMLNSYDPVSGRLRGINAAQPQPSKQPLHPFHWAGFVVVGTP